NMDYKDLAKELKLENKIFSIFRNDNLEGEEIAPCACFLNVFNTLKEGQTVLVSPESKTCMGAIRGCGFKEGLPDISGGFGNFIAQGKGEGFPPGERIKASPEIAEEMILNQRDNVKKSDKIGITIYDNVDDSNKNNTVNPDTIMFIVNPDQLSALVHLFSYRNSAYDNVIMPMSSGCASIFRIPFGELDYGTKRGVVGNVDIFSRPHFDKNTFCFTIPFESFKEMLEDADECFFISHIWEGVKNRL
ncbi:MAG: DUF169 domain-containing protein, partial [Methanobacteriaceae archaeon]